MSITHSLVQRHKGRGIKTWYIRTCTNGNDSYKSTKTTNKTEAMKIFAAFVNNESARIKKNLDEIVINDEFKAFMDMVATEHGKTSHTYRAYAFNAKRFLDFAANNRLRTFADITKAKAQEYVDRSAEKYAAKTIHENIKFVRMVFARIADRNEILVKNPFANVKTPKMAEKMADFWTTEQCDAIIAQAKSPQWAAFWGVQCFAGLRFFEAQKLRIEDIDGKRMTIHQGKMGKDAILPISDKLKALLDNAIAGRESGKLFNELPTHNHNCIVQLQQAARAAGLECEGKAYNHRLRHSFASNLLRGGVNVRSVQELGRWSSTAVLFKHYAGVIDKDLVDAVNIL